MVVLKQLPSQAIISTLAGVIDFYLWKGIPCARMWPTWKPRTPTPLEKANQDAFAHANRAWKNLRAGLRKPYEDMAAGTPLRAQDLFVRAYMKGIEY